jgi:hypothetical protein
MISGNMPVHTPQHLLLPCRGLCVEQLRQIKPCLLHLYMLSGLLAGPPHFPHREAFASASEILGFDSASTIAFQSPMVHLMHMTILAQSESRAELASCLPSVMNPCHLQPRKSRVLTSYPSGLAERKKKKVVGYAKNRQPMILVGERGVCGHAPGSLCRIFCKETRQRGGQMPMIQTGPWPTRRADRSIGRPYVLRTAPL